MLLSRLLTDKLNYAHLAALTKGEHEVLLDTEDACVVHDKGSDVFAAEIAVSTAVEDAIEKVVEVLHAKHAELVETTCPELYALLAPEYAEHYACRQYVFTGTYKVSRNVRPLREIDLLSVYRTQHLYDRDYIRALWENGRILGLYRGIFLIGYVAYHVDGTLGALYIRPGYRGKGSGRHLLESAIGYFGDGLYSHVLVDNEASVRLHESVFAAKAEVTIFWMHNRCFSYNSSSGSYTP